MENTKSKNSKYIFFSLAIAFLSCFLLLNTPFLKLLNDEIITIIYSLIFGLKLALTSSLSIGRNYLFSNIVNDVLPYTFKYMFLYFSLICYIIYIYKSKISKKLLCLIPTYIFIFTLFIINFSYINGFVWYNFFIRSLYNLGFISYRPSVIRSFSDFILVFYDKILIGYNILSFLSSLLKPFLILLMIICFVLNFINLILNLKVKKIFKALLFVILGLFTYNLIDVLVLCNLLLTLAQAFIIPFLSNYIVYEEVYFLLQLIFILYEFMKIIIILGNAFTYIISFIITLVTFVLFVVYVFRNKDINSKTVKILSLVLPLIIIAFVLFVFSINGIFNTYNIIKSILNLFIVF